MIVELEDIRDVFNIFHDGDIIEHSISNDVLCLVIEIPYLAARIDTNFRKFNLVLHGCKSLVFSTWPNQKDSEGEILKDIESIFKPKLWVLSAKLIQNKIEVACSQSDAAFDYCGGNLSFTANSAVVTDEGNKEYTIDELDHICESYWTEWEDENKNRV